MSVRCQCGESATVYAGGPYAGDWADNYCDQHIPQGFQVWERHERVNT